MTEDLKLILASNLIRLRTAENLTQAELGRLLNYSDKTISKWERGESMPDVCALKNIAEIFHRSMDDLVTDHDQWQPPARKKPLYLRGFNGPGAIAVCLGGLWTLAALLLVLLRILGETRWTVVFVVLPVSLALHLVLDALWNGGRRALLLAECLLGSLFLLLYALLSAYHPWQIFLLTPFAGGILYAGFHIAKSAD